MRISATNNWLPSCEKKQKNWGETRQSKNLNIVNRRLWLMVVGTTFCIKRVWGMRNLREIPHLENGWSKRWSDKVVYLKRNSILWLDSLYFSLVLSINMVNSHGIRYDKHTVRLFLRGVTNNKCCNNANSKLVARLSGIILNGET